MKVMLLIVDVDFDTHLSFLFWLTYSLQNQSCSRNMYTKHSFFAKMSCSGARLFVTYQCEPQFVCIRHYPLDFTVFASSLLSSSFSKSRGGYSSNESSMNPAGKHKMKKIVWTAPRESMHAH
jgi:hypothetical protein